MIYLIDFENVANSGFNGIEKLNGEDKIIIFYSENRSTISINVHRKLEITKAKKEYISIKAGGKNALDFQLVSWLGYLIKDNENTEFCIVSNDRGFDFVVDFWSKKNVKVNRSIDLNGIHMKHAKARIQELLPDFNDDAGIILDIISRYKTKQGINNALVKKYGTSQAGIIYKTIKPLLVGKKGK